MIMILVFSRDRALQIQATLASLGLRASDHSIARVAVLYKATTRRHLGQYERLASEFAGGVRFVQEMDFRQQVLELLNASFGGLHNKQWKETQRDQSDHCLFLVDDTIFIRSFRLQSASAALDANRDALGFSLRLGRNTTECYSANRRQRLPKFQALGSEVLKFGWTRSDGDFGYPLELSSSLYSARTIGELLQGIEFENPSTLESQMSIRARDYASSHPALLCYEQSVAFSAPLNRVQTVFPNRTASSRQYSPDHLADLFDAGKRLNVAALEGFVPRACHQEIEPEFE